MRWVSWGLIIVVTTVAVVWLAMLWRMWALRFDFDIAARNPALACLTSFTRYRQYCKYPKQRIDIMDRW